MPTTHDQPTSLADAVQAIRQMRSALAAMVMGIPGLRFRKPNDLSNALGLDPKLAWKIGRSLEESDPFAAAQYLPGPTGIKKLVAAASHHDTPPELIEATRAASDNFNAIVRHQAGTRKNFNILMTGNSRAIRPSAEIEHRRRAFEGNSYVFGVYARTIFRTCITMPSENPDWWDFATLRGFIEFCRLRPNVAWRMTSPASVDAERAYHHPAEHIPIDPNASTDPNTLPLMLDHCTHPLPKFRRIKGPYGDTEFEFVADSVGIDSRINCVTGQMLHHFEPRYRTEAYDNLCFSFPIRTPAHVAVFDVLINRRLFETTDALRVKLCNDLFGGGPGFYYEHSDRLPLLEELSYLGRGPDVAVTTDIPGYLQMLQLAMRRFGCVADDYDVYRIRIEYPPITTRLLIERPYPERPTP